jgi:hypothetical protein
MEEAEKNSFLARVNSGDKEAIKQYICSKNWVVTTGGCNTAIRIATCESGLRPDAVGDLHLDNGTNPSYGVFQIRYFGGARGTKEQLLTATYNIDKAYEMSGGGTNWSPWSCK